MKRRHVAVSIAVLAELLAVCGMAATGNLQTHVVAFLALFTAAIVAFLFAWRRLQGTPLRLTTIAAIALLLRLPLLFTQPTLSDDVWRYLHDGRAQLAGVSPYALPPADPKTQLFRGPEFAQINHPQLVTIYPPAAQAAFALNALLGSHLLVWRLLLIACELAGLIVLARLLRRAGRDPTNLVLYAWHPLAIVEVAGSAHLEPIGIAFLLTGLAAAWRGHQLHAGILLGLSVAFKFVAAPILAVSDELLKPRLILACSATGLLAYALYGYDSAFGSLPTFAASWEANASIYSVLTLVLDGHRARIIAATLLVCVLAAIRRSRYATSDRIALFLLALLLVSPVAHPWYLLWLLVMLPITTVLWLRNAALVWSVTVPLAYAPAAGVWLEYLPVFAVLLWAAFRTARQHSRAETSSRRTGRRLQISA